MRALLLAALVLTGFVGAPAAVDDATACEPYAVVCPPNGQTYDGCGTTLPHESPLARCAMATLPP